MIGFEILAGMSALLGGLGVVELARHRKRLEAIPVRVHVNGTRGKSSVTRLIAAGMRSGGVTTCAKTTGTLARMILPDGRELPVFRPAKANVIEQRRIVDMAYSWGAEALIMECMALQPYLQWLCEARLVQATHGVITNARPDHLDVMGPSEVDVAKALAGMVPTTPGAKMYTAERDHLAIFGEACADRGVELIPTTLEDVQAITEDDLAGFPYREHPDNLALALRICADLGVAREVALRGMWSAKPDPGAMTCSSIEFFGRFIEFYNGFAANDPESTEQIWRMALDRHPEAETRIAVFNCRADRADRSRQLGEAYAQWPAADHVVLMGTGTYLFARAAVRAGVSPDQMVYAEDLRVEEIFEIIVGLCRSRAMVMGMGNIGGLGLDVARFFQNRTRPEPGPRSIPGPAADRAPHVESDNA